MLSQPSQTNTYHPVSRLAVRYFKDRRLIALTILLIASAGLSSLAVLPRMEDPLLTQRAATIVTVFPGADAERVEALVTEKIEDKLIDVPEIKRIRSQSRAGSSFISIELRDDVYETDPVWSSIRGKLEDSISLLPAGAQRPEFNELDIAAYAWIGAIVWDRDEPAAHGVLRRMARELKDEFFTVSGTKTVDLFGDPLEEIVVEIDPDRAAAVGLSAAAVATQLGNRDVKSSAGVMRSDRTDLVVELHNEFESIEDILTAALQAPGSPGMAPAANSARVSNSDFGQTLRLADVASVRRSTREPPAARAIIDGKPGIVVSVLLRPEYRIDQWAADAQSHIERFRERLPAGIELDIIMEQDRYVSARLSSLTMNLLVGVCAVSAVTFIFMGWRSSLLVTATLPLASLMVIAAMRFFGIPIHQMSITGLIIALGLLIDNAIIAADEIELSLRRGLTPVNAVADMVSRLFAPLVASTVTTALAFAPIALMEGPAGEFVGSIAMTVMLAIFSSLFLALTVLPASAAILQKSNTIQHSTPPAMDPSNVGHSNVDHSHVGHNGNFAGSVAVMAAGTAMHPVGFWRRMSQHGISLPWVTQLYRRFLTGLLKAPAAGIVLGLVLPIGGFIAATQLSEQFFPPADRNQFQIELELASDASLDQTSGLVLELDKVLIAHPQVKHTTWFVGESAPAFYYNVISRRKNSPNYAQAIVTLDSEEDSLELIRELQWELDDLFPAARLLVRQLEQGPPFDAPVEVRLYGPDLDQLKEFGEELRSLTTTVPNVLHVRTALSEFRPSAMIAVNAHQANWVGLTEAEIAQQLFAQLDGLPAGSIIEQVEEIPVRVRISGTHRQHIEDVSDRSLLVSTPTAALNATAITRQAIVPVSSVAEVSLAPQRAVITRYNGRRINEVQSFITAGTLPSKVLAGVEAQLASSQFEDRLPDGYFIEFGGEASERDAAVSRLMANVSVLAVGMVGALVLALASFRLASLIGIVAMLSIGLGMGALWVFGYPFGFMAIVGTMGLIGIAINDSIVVVAALKANPQVVAGDLDATVETVIEVTRHVLATTATTVVGFLPLLLSGGGFWPPLAVAIGTGVIGATLISLTFVPCAMRLLKVKRAASAPAPQTT